MKLYYSRLNFDSLEKIVSPFKNGETIKSLFLHQKPLALINLYLSEILRTATKDLATAMNIFNSANVFYDKEEKQDGDLLITPVTDPHLCAKHTIIRFKDLDKYNTENGLDGITITPMEFESIVDLIVMASAFSCVYKIEEEKITGQQASFLVKTYNYHDNIQELLQLIVDPYSVEVKEDPLFTEKLVINAMPCWQALELKQYLLNLLTGKEIFNEVVFEKYSKYVSLDGKPLSVLQTLMDGRYSLLYQILFLVVDFSYCPRKKKNQFLTALEEKYRQTLDKTLETE